MSQIEERTIKISYSNLEDIIAAFLVQTGVIAGDEDILGIDIPLPIDDEGLVELDLEVMKIPSFRKAS